MKDVPRETSPFRERLGFALWLVHLRTGDMPTDQAVANAADRSQPVVRAWRLGVSTPTDWQLFERLGAFLSVSAEWLMKGREAAPEPALWAVWSAAAPDREEARAAETESPPETKSGAPKMPLRKPQRAVIPRRGGGRGA